MIFLGLFNHFTAILETPIRRFMNHPIPKFGKPSSSEDEPKQTLFTQVLDFGTILMTRLGNLISLFWYIGKLVSVSDP